jgi:multiphosphoryl transfer protein
MPSHTILAPFGGWCTPLDEVPDEVFAGRMLGDGLAIDPTEGILIAPCDGEILTLPDSRHAVSMRSEAGIELLIHVGIDTVKLAGRGFDARVRAGSFVKAGDEIIRFDLDAVARAAKSLMTPIVVTSEGAVLKSRRATGSVRAGEMLFEVDVPGLSGGTVTSHSTISGPVFSREHIVIVTLPQGLHARPAALLARRAKAINAPIALAAHGRETDARSVVGIMALGVRQGDELLIRAEGAQAQQALAEMIASLEEAQKLDAAHGPVNVIPATKSDESSRPGQMTGVCAVPGMAVGRATRIERRTIEVSEQGLGNLQEKNALERARLEVRLRLERMRNAGGAERGAIIGAHLEFLDDPILTTGALTLIAQGKSAGYAWRHATRRAIAELEALNDSRLRERADDLLDVEGHILLALIGEARPMHQPLPDEAVLLADELLPSELTALDRRRLAAIVLSGGGATSHVAILAAAMEIPMLIGMGAALRSIADGQTVIVDADKGILDYAPAPQAVAAARAAMESHRVKSAARRAAAAQECRSLDGTRIEVFANLGGVPDGLSAVENGAEGCGLLRTEFLFIDRDTAPDEDEQAAAYQSIANALAGRPLILRLMDVGGDKPLKYLPLPHEANPALGLRGIRSAIAHPALMHTQLRAAMRVKPRGIVRLLIPMVTDLAEVLTVRSAVEEVAREMGLAGRIAIGAMIETPAAALTAAILLKEVDFLSVGSNDLTQYTLAMDRGHSQLARRTDALHPAVLQLIAAAGRAGAAAGKLVAVCGGVAADRTAVPILLGLGVRELSVVPSLVPAIKEQISALRIDNCERLSQRCLAQGSAAEVRGLVEAAAAQGELA